MDIRKKLLISNKKILKKKLAIQNFGNVSVKQGKIFYIKPSGINLNILKYSEFPKVHIYKDTNIQNKYLPSTDTPTHKKLYSEYNEIGSIVHTHSLYATAWAQAIRPIPCLGTTHADFSISEIPVTRKLKKNEIENNYELNTANVIIERFKKLRLNIFDCPGIIVANHGPFAWGKNLEDALKNAELIEYISKLAILTNFINPEIRIISKNLHKKHFLRKHGKESYYGQKLSDN